MARELVERSLGPGHPGEPDPAGRAAHRRRAGAQVRRAVQVLGAGRGPLAGDAQGLLRRRRSTRRPPKVTDEQVAEALEGYRRRLTAVQAGRGAHARPATTDVVLVELHGKVGEHKIKKRELAVDLRTTPAAPLPGLASAAARPADRRRRPIEVDYTLADEGSPPRLAGRARRPARHHQGGAREAGARARRRAGQGHRRGRDARGAARQGPRAAGRDRQAAHQARDGCRR